MKSLLVSLLLVLGLYNVAAAELTSTSVTNLVKEITIDANTAMIGSEVGPYVTVVSNINRLSLELRNVSTEVRPAARWAVTNLIETLEELSPELDTRVLHAQERAESLTAKLDETGDHAEALNSFRDIQLSVTKREIAALKELNLPGIQARLERLNAKLQD